MACHLGFAVNDLHERLKGWLGTGGTDFLGERVVFNKHIASEHGAGDFAVVGTVADELKQVNKL